MALWHHQLDGHELVMDREAWRAVIHGVAPDTPGSPEGNTEGPGTASSEPLLPS